MIPGPHPDDGCTAWAAALAEQGRDSAASCSWTGTFAGFAVFLEDVAPGAGALVAALRVLADEVTWLRRLVTLVQI